MSNLSPSCPFQGKVSSFVLHGHLVSCSSFKRRDEDHDWLVFHKSFSTFAHYFFPDSCLCPLSKCTPARLCSFVHFLNSAWELEGHVFSLSSYEPCNLCAAPTNVASSVGRISAESSQALWGLSHRWICFIWVQMVGTVVYLSILWPHLRLPKVELSVAESAFTIDTSVKYRQRWLSWWYENMSGPNTGNHIVTVNAVIGVMTLKSND